MDSEMVRWRDKTYKSTANAAVIPFRSSNRFLALALIFFRHYPQSPLAYMECDERTLMDVSMSMSMSVCVSVKRILCACLDTAKAYEACFGNLQLPCSE